MIHLDRIKSVLIHNGVLNEETFKSYVEEAHQKEISIEEYLVQLKLISEEALFEQLAADLKLPFINLVGKKIDEPTLQQIPESIAQAHQVMAFDEQNGECWLATLDPEDLQTLDFLQKKIGKPLRPHLTTHRSLREALKLYHKGLEEEMDLERTPLGASRSEAVIAGVPVEKLATDLPVIRIVESILKTAIYESASDIHVEPTEDELIVRFRVDGVLRKVMSLPLQAQAGVVARIKVLANLKLDEHRLPQDGRFKMRNDQFNFAARVSVIPVMGGEKVVMRLLDESPHALSFEDLGLTGVALETLQRNMRKPHGIILITGPTGSGKTTTLYTMLQQLNTPEVNISTIEDPIEYRLKGINQSQVNPKIGFHFAQGLRALLRQDPNIIMVGEIRDTETARICAQAAMTGHLVLSTLHTNDAVTALPRLRDMGVELFLIASTINLVIAQRLVRRICDRCIESVPYGDAQVKEIEKTLGIASLRQRLSDRPTKEKEKGDDEKSELLFYKGKGCDACGGDGYKGRVGIYEVLEINDAISDALTRQISADELSRLAREQGMRTMADDGLIKAQRGMTTIEEILRVTKE